MAQHYAPLPTDEQDSEPLKLEYQRKPLWRRIATAHYLKIIAILVLTNTLSYCAGHYWHPLKDRTPEVYTLNKTWKQFWWNTPYSAVQNQSSTDELWDNILPSHGFIAIDRKVADNRGWPESMYLPSDKSKGVYLLEAYHYLHCLKILRKTFSQAVNGEPYTYTPGPHTYHCFDALLQYVVCNADSTPLYTFGDFTAGHGQVHRCKDWSQLRRYAAEQTACYKDSIELIPLGDHFGFCSDGDDGVLDLV